MVKFNLHTIDQSGHSKSEVLEKSSNEDAKIFGQQHAAKNPLKSIHLTDADGSTVFWRPAPTVNVHLYRKGEHARSTGFDVRQSDALRYAESWANNNPEHYALVQTSDGNKVDEFGAAPEKLKSKSEAKTDGKTEGK